MLRVGWLVGVLLALSACQSAGESSDVADAFEGSTLQGAAVRMAEVANAISGSEEAKSDEIVEFGLLRACLGEQQSARVLELAETDVGALAAALLSHTSAESLRVPSLDLDGCEHLEPRIDLTTDCDPADVVYVPNPAHTAAQAAHDVALMRQALATDYPEAALLVGSAVIVDGAADSRLGLADHSWRMPDPANFPAAGLRTVFDGFVPADAVGTDAALAVTIESPGRGWLDRVHGQVSQLSSDSGTPTTVIASGSGSDAIEAGRLGMAIGPARRTVGVPTVRNVWDPVRQDDDVTADIADQTSIGRWETFRSHVVFSTFRLSPISNLFESDLAADPLTLRSGYAAWLDGETREDVRTAFEDVPALIDLGTVETASLSSYLAPGSRFRREVVRGFAAALADASRCDELRPAPLQPPSFVDQPPIDGTVITVDLDTTVNIEIRSADLQQAELHRLALSVRDSDGRCSVDSTVSVVAGDGNDAVAGGLSLAGAGCAAAGPFSLRVVTSSLEANDGQAEDVWTVRIEPLVRRVGVGPGIGTVRLWVFEDAEPSELSEIETASTLATPQRPERWLVPPGEHEVRLSLPGSECGPPLRFSVDGSAVIEPIETSCTAYRVRVTNPGGEPVALTVAQPTPSMLPMDYLIRIVP